MYEEFDMQRPKVVPEYSQMMKGVDQFDQNMSYYHFYRRTTKWTTKMNLYLLQAMLQNAHTLYRKFSTDEKKRSYHTLNFSWLQVNYSLILTLIAGWMIPVRPHLLLMRNYLSLKDYGQGQARSRYCP